MICELEIFENEQGNKLMITPVIFSFAGVKINNLFGLQTFHVYKPTSMLQ